MLAQSRSNRLSTYIIIHKATAAAAIRYQLNKKTLGLLRKTLLSPRTFEDVPVVQHKFSQQKPSIPHVAACAPLKHVVRAVHSD
jgi:hypothetical protein